jgi:adenylate cyclase
MALEIERKFLVHPNHPELVTLLKNHKGVFIFQGYLSDEPERTVRIRILSEPEKAFLTIKGKQVGISKPEFEYEIPYLDALQLMPLAKTSLQKTRHCIKRDDGLKWEIDVFKNSDLILAEIELPSENYSFSLPDWIVKDVSEDFAYSNAELAKTLKQR